MVQSAQLLQSHISTPAMVGSHYLHLTKILDRSVAVAPTKLSHGDGPSWAVVPTPPGVMLRQQAHPWALG